MGRRKRNSLPELRNHRGRARFRLNGREHYCGAFGSPESYKTRDRIVGEILCGRVAEVRPPRDEGNQEPAALRLDAQATEPTFVVPPELSGVSRQPTIGSMNRTAIVYPHHDGLNVIDADGITVLELALHWLDDIQNTRCARGKSRTSKYYGARQVINMLEDYWKLPASKFGTRALREVQKKLECTPVASRPKDPSKKPKVRQRTRQGINEMLTKIRALFKYGVVLEVITQQHADSLRAVPALVRGQSKAPEGNTKRPVDDGIVEATLPYLPHVVVDLIRFALICGCRPCEARQLRPCEIDMRTLPQYKGCWLWRPEDWKLDHLEGIAPREIWISPEAQAILRPWLEPLARSPTRHVFSPRRRIRPKAGEQPSDNSTGRTPRSLRSRRQRTNDFYSKDSLNKAIRRACDSNGLPIWRAGQLRHTRLTEIRETMGLDHAQAVAGHSSPSQTEHYAHLRREKALEVALRERRPATIRNNP